MKASRFNLLLLLPILILANASCSRLEVGLKFADRLALYALTDYFQLDDDEREEIRTVFNNNLSQLQKENFAALAVKLESLAGSVEARSLTEPGLQSFSKELEGDFIRAIQSFEPMGQKLVEYESAKGFKTFDAQFAEKLAEDKKTLSKKPDARLQSERRKIDNIVGDSIEYLTDAQKKDVDETLSKSPPPNAEQLASREAVFAAFQKARAEPASRSAFVREFFMKWEELQTPEYRKARAAYRKEMEALSWRIYSTLNDEQRRDLVKNLRSRAKELKSIAAKAA